MLKTLLHGTKVPKLASRAWARANSQVGAPSRKLARQVRTWRANLRLGARQMSPHRSNHRLAYHCCHWKFRPSPALAHLARRKHCSIFFLLMCKRLRMCKKLSNQSYKSYIEVTCLVQPGRRPPYSLCTPFASSTTTPKPKIFYYITPSPDYLSGSLPPTPSACDPPCPPSPALWPPAVWTPGRLYFHLESCALRFHISGLCAAPLL